MIATEHKERVERARKVVNGFIRQNRFKHDYFALIDRDQDCAEELLTKMMEDRKKQYTHSEISCAFVFYAIRYNEKRNRTLDFIKQSLKKRNSNINAVNCQQKYI